jgi:ATP-dependent Clp protease ATP-binding subunit ClpA
MERAIERLIARPLAENLLRNELPDGVNLRVLVHEGAMMFEKM